MRKAGLSCPRIMWRFLTCRVQYLSPCRINHGGMMLNMRLFIVPGVFIVAFLLCAGCTQGTSLAPVQETVAPTAVIALETTPAGAAPVIPRAATRDEMVAFVKEAVAYARTNGKEKALAEFSNRNGSFFRGELYIYAYDANGTTIAHPVNPEKIGVNRLYEKDAEGNLFIQELRSAATNGTGFVTYYYINPVHKNIIEKKLGYAMNVDPTWWLGSGIYQGLADTPVLPATEARPSSGYPTTVPEK
jgi:cytochrome c